MGRSVKVSIGEKTFASKKAAVDYFMDQCDDVREWGAITGGPLFEELKTLYLRYCEITRFSLGNREIYAFCVDYETRHTDQNYGTHLCYWVQFSPTDRLSFSVRKAVDEIAKASAAEQQ